MKKFRKTSCANKKNADCFKEFSVRVTKRTKNCFFFPNKTNELIDLKTNREKKRQQY